MREILVALLVLAVAVGIGGYAALLYATRVPGESHQGALPPLTAEEYTTAAALKRHIGVVATSERNIAHYADLEKAAVYLEGVLSSLGYTVGRQEYVVDGKKVRNIDAVIEARSAADPEVIVVGAHYDTAPNTPGANDNGSGIASVLELARLLTNLRGKSDKRIRFVLFVNEEPPYFWTEHMGSVHYARLLAERKERVTAMFSLETLGYYSDEPGSQNYPVPFGVMFPNRGNFVSFVGLTNSRPLVQQSIASFRSHTQFPTVGGVAPRLIPGIGWSDHSSFSQYGFQALMVTDTAIFRYPHYHEPTDTPDKVDTEKLARVVKGLERVVRDLAR